MLVAGIVRERLVAAIGDAAAVVASYEARSDETFTISAQLDPSNIGATTATYVRELTRLRDEGPTAAELARARRRALGLTGICLGFLPHNYHPARIFMGDTGAMLIGLLLAYAPISSLASLDPGSLVHRAGTVNRFGAILPLLLPAAILLIPYADLLMAVFRRARAGMSPFAPDRKHLHHRLLDIGHSHRSSVLIMYLWATLFSGTVVWLSIAKTQLFVLAVATAASPFAVK
jgi:hypothetical protein